MKTYLIDTNFLLRFLLKDVPDQSQKSKQYITQAKDKKIKIVIPQIIIFEIYYVLSKYYNFPKQQIANALQKILSTKYLSIENKNTFLNTLSLWKNNNIEFVDNFLLSLSQEKKYQILTFDKKLKDKT